MRRSCGRDALPPRGVRAADRRSVGRRAGSRRDPASRRPDRRCLRPAAALAGTRMGRLAGCDAPEEPVRRRRQECSGRWIGSGREASPRPASTSPVPRGRRSTRGAASRTSCATRSYPGAKESALLTGETGILLVAWRLTGERALSDDLHARVVANVAERGRGGDVGNSRARSSRLGACSSGPARTGGTRPARPARRRSGRGEMRAGSGRSASTAARSGASALRTASSGTCRRSGPRWTTSGGPTSSGT